MAFHYIRPYLLQWGKDVISKPTPCGGMGLGAELAFIIRRWAVLYKASGALWGVPVPHQTFTIGLHITANEKHPPNNPRSTLCVSSEEQYGRHALLTYTLHQH